MQNYYCYRHKNVYAVDMKILIPNYKIPSLNEYVGKHWSVGHKLKNECKQLVMAYGRHIPPAEKKRRVDIHMVLGKGRRKLDPDNCRKLVHDALVHTGALWDDNDEWCQIGDITYSRGDPSTEITLTDV